MALGPKTYITARNERHKYYMTSTEFENVAVGVRWNQINLDHNEAVDNLVGDNPWRRKQIRSIISFTAIGIP